MGIVSDNYVTNIFCFVLYAIIGCIIIIGALILIFPELLLFALVLVLIMSYYGLNKITKYVDTNNQNLTKDIQDLNGYKKFQNIVLDETTKCKENEIKFLKDSKQQPVNEKLNKFPLQHELIVSGYSREIEIHMIVPEDVIAMIHSYYHNINNHKKRKKVRKYIKWQWRKGRRRKRRRNKLK
eukprot:132459_1